jgi:hypothetical protein
LLVDEPSPEALRAAIREVREREWDPHALRERAEMFSRERFVERFSDHVAGVLDGDREPVRL